MLELMKTTFLFWNGFHEFQNSDSLRIVQLSVLETYETQTQLIHAFQKRCIKASEVARFWRETVFRGVIPAHLWKNSILAFPPKACNFARFYAAFLKSMNQLRSKFIGFRFWTYRKTQGYAILELTICA